MSPYVCLIRSLFLPQDGLWHLFSPVAPGKVWLPKNLLILALHWFPLLCVLRAHQRLPPGSLLPWHSFPAVLFCWNFRNILRCSLWSVLVPLLHNWFQAPAASLRFQAIWAALSLGLPWLPGTTLHPIHCQPPGTELLAQPQKCDLKLWLHAKNYSVCLRAVTEIRNCKGATLFCFHFLLAGLLLLWKYSVELLGTAFLFDTIFICCELVVLCSQSFLYNLSWKQCGGSNRYVLWNTCISEANLIVPGCHACQLTDWAYSCTSNPTASYHCAVSKRKNNWKMWVACT